jgi:hypothetical protein
MILARGVGSLLRWLSLGIPLRGVPGSRELRIRLLTGARARLARYLMLLLLLLLGMAWWRSLPRRRQCLCRVAILTRRGSLLLLLWRWHHARILGWGWALTLPLRVSLGRL